MQKILSFELATALRGRPKVFKAITLFLLSLSIAVLLFTFARFLDPDKTSEVSRQRTTVSLAETASTDGLVQLEK